MMRSEESAEKHSYPTGIKEVSELLGHCRPDRIPIGHMSFGFSGRNAGFSVRHILEDPEDAFKALSWTAEMYQWSPIPLPGDHPGGFALSRRLCPGRGMRYPGHGPAGQRLRPDPGGPGF